MVEAVGGGAIVFEGLTSCISLLSVREVTISFWLSFLNDRT